MKTELDHVVVAAPDLAAACEAFADRTGCRPQPGGEHPGLGTHNAVVGFGADCYLEILAPAPAHSTPTNLGGRLAELALPELFAWALRTDDLDSLSRALRRRGIDTTPPIETRRELPNGETLVWDLLGLPGRGGAWPFFIDWRGCPHPSDEAPRVGALRKLAVTLPVDEPEGLPFGAAAPVELSAGSALLELAFDSARGPVEWRRHAPTGFFG